MRGAGLSVTAVFGFVMMLAPAPPQAAQATAPAPAQGAATATLPAAKDLFEKHVQAVGGRAAMLAYSSRKATGTIAMPASGMNGTLEIFQARPNRFLMRITLPGVGTMEDGYDGTVGWGINPLTGPALLSGKELEDKREDADFAPELDVEKRYTSLKTVERTDFDGRPCFKVIVTRKSGGEDTVFFDAATGLRAGGVISRESPMGPVTATSYETDYKPFGKLKYATRVRLMTMNIEQVLTLTSVEHDTVDASVFVLPPQIKALIK